MRETFDMSRNDAKHQHERPARETVDTAASQNWVHLLGKL